MANHYELVYIVSIKHTGDDLQKVIDSVKKSIKDFNGTITLDDILGKRKLSYSIKGVTQGTYVVNEFDLPKQNLIELDKFLRLKDEVLRHLITIKKEKTAEEIAREKKIQERLLKNKEEELAQAEGHKKTAKPANVVEEKEEIKEKQEKLEKVELKEKSEKGKVSLEDLDKKLDEILTDDII